MSLKRLLVPPLHTAFNPENTPVAVPLPDTLVKPAVAVPAALPAPIGTWGGQPEWNTAHSSRMRAVEWVVGGALMAYFAAGLAGALGLM